MRSLLLIALLTLSSCRRVNYSDFSEETILHEEVQERQFLSLLGFSREEIEHLIVEGMPITEVYELLGSPYVQSDFSGERKGEYHFLDDFFELPESGTLISLSVYHRDSLVTRWAGGYQGGVYRKFGKGDIIQVN